jgi:hypothetical protein
VRFSPGSSSPAPPDTDRGQPGNGTNVGQAREFQGTGGIDLHHHVSTAVTSADGWDLYAHGPITHGMPAYSSSQNGAWRRAKLMIANAESSIRNRRFCSKSRIVSAISTWES